MDDNGRIVVVRIFAQTAEKAKVLLMGLDMDTNERIRDNINGQEFVKRWYDDKD